MLQKERRYGFRERMLQVHQKDIRDYALTPNADEFEMVDGMFIAVGNNADIVIETAAKDFVDYLYVSMGVSAAVTKNSALKGAVNVVIADGTIDMAGADATKGFRIDTDADGITVTGFDARGCAQGLYYLEKCMTMRRAPFISCGTVKKKPLFSPQMVHSGYGLDHYPNEHLAQIAHEGRDAILIFVKDVDITPYGYLDFNELIYRAAIYGIDVYVYSYIVNKKHPEDEGGLAYYEGTYGKLFKECPKLKGVVLVEGSLCFPSKDPRVRADTELVPRMDVIPTGKGSTAGTPAYDFNMWISTIHRIIRQYNKKAELIAWSYSVMNSGLETRREWMDQLPKDIVLLVTAGKSVWYENKAGVKCYGADYTLTFSGLGKGFWEDVEYAHKKGLKIYAMTNTGGLTWDMGVMPYQPGAYLWMERYEQLIEAAQKYGICGIMECHHYGIYPSIISKLSNEVFRDPAVSMDKHLEDVIIHDFGEEYVEEIKQALHCMSDSNAYMTHSRVDSSSVNRVGAAWPLCIKLALKVPTVSYAHFGNRIMCARYEDETPWGLDYRLHSESVPEEMESWKKASECAEKGVAILKSLAEPNEKLERLTVLCEYIACQCVSGVHAKWWYLKKLQLDRAKKEEVPAIVQEMRDLATLEIKNAERAIACAEVDSRLGWEPSMEYIADAEHLRWKIAQVNYAIGSELDEYLRAAREEA